MDQFDHSCTLYSPLSSHVQSSGSHSYSKHLTSWEGHEEHAVGHGVDGVVRVLLSLGSDLLVAGAFTRVYQSRSTGHVGNALHTGGIALWNAAAREWRHFDSVPVAAAVSAVVRNGTQLFVAGSFRHGMPERCRGLCSAEFSLDQGSTTPVAWAEVGGGVSGGILTMLMVEAHGLFVGGSFRSAGVIAERNAHLALWDGDRWHSMGDVTHTVRALATLGEHLYVGGDFSSVSGLPVPYFARYHLTKGTWEPATEKPLLNAPVMVIRPLGPCLYLGGGFTAPSPHVTRYCLGRDVAFDAVDGAQDLGPVNVIAAASDVDETATLARRPERLLCHFEPSLSQGATQICRDFDADFWNV
jgi:hypothetical protein